MTRDLQQGARKCHDAGTQLRSCALSIPGAKWLRIACVSLWTTMNLARRATAVDATIIVLGLRENGARSLGVWRGQQHAANDENDGPTPHCCSQIRSFLGAQGRKGFTVRVVPPPDRGFYSTPCMGARERFTFHIYMVPEHVPTLALFTTAVQSRDGNTTETPFKYQSRDFVSHVLRK